MIDTIKRAIPPIHPEGFRFIAIFAAVTIVLFWISDILGWIGVGLTLWCALFFRDPVRVTPIDESLVVSPADGRVSYAGPAVAPPNLNLGEGDWIRVSVFMSVFDCHVNRAPVSGTIATVSYEPGLFLNAELDKASDDNERNSLSIKMQDGRMIGVVQIAGFIARRILCFVRESDLVGAGERFGLIRFGSRLDVYLPADTHIEVAVGQRAVAGETILARFGVPATDRVVRQS